MLLLLYVFHLVIPSIHVLCQGRQGALISHAPETGSLCQECTVSPESIKEITSHPLASLSRLSRHLQPLPLRTPSASQTENSTALLARREASPEAGGRERRSDTGTKCVSGTRAPGCPFPQCPGANRRSRDRSPGEKSAAARLLNAGSSSRRGPTKVPPAAANALQ